MRVTLLGRKNTYPIPIRSVLWLFVASDVWKLPKSNSITLGVILLFPHWELLLYDGRIIIISSNAIYNNNSSQFDFLCGIFCHYDSNLYEFSMDQEIKF